MLVLEGLVGLHRIIQIQHLIADIEWFALELNRDHSIVFEIASAFQTLLLTVMAIPFLLRDSCPQ